MIIEDLVEQKIYYVTGDTLYSSAAPYHVGMFDDMSHEIFDIEEKLILEVYKEREV